MEKKEVILLTGHKGFIGGEILKKLTGTDAKDKYTVITLTEEVQDLTYWGLENLLELAGHNMDDLTSIWHFASPSEEIQFNDPYKMAERMIDATMKLSFIWKNINELRINDKKDPVTFVYASSMAQDEVTNGLGGRDLYARYKRTLSDYFLAQKHSTMILNIPRVYGTHRTKGLMRKFKEGIPRAHLGNEVMWMEIEPFVDATIEGINHFHKNIKILNEGVSNENGTWTTASMHKQLSYTEFCQINTLEEVADQLGLTVHLSIK